MRGCAGLLALLVGCGADAPMDGEAESSSGGAPTGGATAGTSVATTTTTGAVDVDSGGSSEGSSEGSASSSTTGPPATCTVADPLEAGDHARMLDFGGNPRTYSIHVPPGLDPETAAPLLLNMHGYLSSPQMQADWSEMNATSDPRGYVVVYPAGVANSWNGGSCCGDAAANDVDDVGFLRAVVAEVASLVCIDPRRVFATGMSNGGYMSHRLACDAAVVFAAVAPVAGALGIPACAPVRPVPVLAFHGVQDPLVAYADDVASFDTWAMVDGCDAAVVQDDFEGGNCRHHDACDGGATVELCTLDPMGHCWPGGNAGLCFAFLGPHSDAIDANATMLDFFDAHPMP